MKATIEERDENLDIRVDHEDKAILIGRARSLPEAYDMVSTVWVDCNVREYFGLNK